MPYSATPTSPSPGPDYTWDPNSGTWVKQWVKKESGTSDASTAQTGYGAPPPAPAQGAPPPPPPVDPNAPTSPSPGDGYIWVAGHGWWHPQKGEYSGWSTETTPRTEGATAATGTAGGGNTSRAGKLLDQYDEDARKAETAYGGIIEAVTGTPGQATAGPGGTPIPGTPGSATVPREAPQVNPLATTVYPSTVTAEKPAAAKAAAPTSITAPTIGTTTSAPIERYGASRVAPTPGATAATATAATLNTDPQAQVRARQLALMNQLEGVAAGTGGPSAAELQGRRQAEDAMAAQLSMAGATHGRGAGAAMRQAARNASVIHSKAAADAAMLRAKETQDVRSQLLAGYEGTRGADIGVAGKEADLSQAVNLQNAEGQTRVSISNADRVAAANMKDAELEQAAAAGNAAAQNEKAQRDAAIEAERKRTEAGLSLDAAKSNQGAETTVNLANAANETQTNIVGATEANKASIINAENDLKAQLANQDTETKVALANAGFTLQGRSIDDERNVAAVRAMLDAQAAIVKNDQDRIAMAFAREQYEDALKRGDREFALKIVGGLLQMGGTIIASSTSDKRRKKEVEVLNTYSDERGKKDKRALLDSYEGKGQDEIGEMLDHLKAVKFKYKDPTERGTAPGQRYGIIAQDLEKSPAGASIVVEEDGVKKIDTNQAVGLLLAAMAQMRHQQKRKAA